MHAASVLVVQVRLQTTVTAMAKTTRLGTLLDSGYLLLSRNVACLLKPKLLKKTKVKKGERYIVIRWLEKEGDDEIHYVLSDVEDCLSGRSVEGIFVVKSLGKINRLPPIGEHGPIKKKNAVKYLLHKDNIGKIACLLPRIPL
jgi:hypothetical protein